MKQGFLSDGTINIVKKLFIAGTGIKFLSHLTLEVKALIEKCDLILYLVNDPAMKKWINDNSKKSISLDPYYFSCQKRIESYDNVAIKVIEETRNHTNTCFLIYGNPFFLSSITEMVIDKANLVGGFFSIEIVPGISSLDTLCCDLKVDPGDQGIQCFEATSFSNKNFKVNEFGHVVIWQIGVSGIKGIIKDSETIKNNPDRINHLRTIREKLIKLYGENHIIVLYVASIYSMASFEKKVIEIKDLLNEDIPRLATGYIPPKT